MSSCFHARSLELFVRIRVGCRRVVGVLEQVLETALCDDCGVSEVGQVRAACRIVDMY
jgi:hypothetical protein